MKQTGAILKFDQWWSAKIPPLLAFAYLLLHANKIRFTEAPEILFFYLVWVISAASFGHYVNDCFDIKQDKIAGKYNLAANHPWPLRWLIAVLLFLITLVPWGFIGSAFFSLGLVLLHTLLFLLYSVPPIRLKERYFFGVITDALYAHVLPFIITIFAFYRTPVGEIPHWLSQILFAGIAWNFLFGIRNILSHQILDFRNDEVSQTKTWVRKLGIERSLAGIKIVIMPVELIAFFLCFYAAGMPYSLVIPFFIVFAIYRYIMYRRLLKLSVNNTELLRGFNYFFSNFYEEVLPLFFLIILCFLDPLYLILLGLHLLAFRQVVLNIFYQTKTIFSI